MLFDGAFSVGIIIIFLLPEVPWIPQDLQKLSRDLNKFVLDG